MKSILSRLCLAFFCLALAATSLEAQSAKLTKANKFYQQLNFRKAIELYENILAKKTEPEALFNLPDCYRRIGDYQKAERWYAKAVLHPEANAELYFYLGLSQLSNNRPQEARVSFEKFRELAPGDLRGPQLIEACNDSLRTLLNNSGALYIVRNVREINTKYDEFGLNTHRKGIVYCAERDTGAAPIFFQSAWTGRPFVDVYYCDRRLVDEETKAYKYGKSRPFDKIVDTRYHDGPVTFSPDGTTMYFTRNYYDKGKVERDGTGIVRTQIMSTKMTNTGWEKKGRRVDFARTSYSVAHPTLNAEGDKMYFASDMPGGFGRMDLYVSYLEGSGWSEPINLGPEINTEGDEVFPWLAADGTLYFASDGHTGLGGLDVYSSKAYKGRWRPLENLGSPINSRFDDFAYMQDDSSGISGYFSSNRDSAVGATDIFFFTKLAVNTELLVFDKVTGKGVDEVSLTSDCFPRKEYLTDINGRVQLQLPLNRGCTFEVFSPAFGDTSVTISTEGYAMGARLFIQVPIVAKKLEIKVEGQVLNDKTGEPLANAAVELMSNCQKASIKGNTDAEGNYSLKALANCQYVIKASKEGYFTSTNKFNTLHVDEDTTFNANVALPELFKLDDPNNPNGEGGSFGGGNPNGFEGEQVYQIDAIYYDYDQDRINLERSTGLQQLLDIMVNNPELVVEIRSHTDSRGDANYNLELSSRRAKAVADYLIAKGISEARLSYLGLGESQLLNGCDDFSSCNEAQHGENRRTEFRVIRQNK
ncbi:OmpA family protein [Saprospira sp. CCB-QB6]|uniref:OmpA family protein n=1 Tax=Saprospira sp. CCB-QB6 TaxID=3023936 RepID=UPI00234ACE70|nr:OmpA family protein [Saprospira sp. CCB-QB6]WCL80331.1 OmpA family protein [Saprospira sp. CCB-QB6]